MDDRSHAGVVAGLLVLTPIFTADLVTERDAAEQAGTAALLDADLPAVFKIGPRTACGGSAVHWSAARCRRSGRRSSDPTERAGALHLENTLQDELDRAATHAFSDSFLIAAGFGLAALLPIGLGRRRGITL